MQRPQTLSELVSQLTSDDLVILDIDSTLLYTYKRNEAILKKFAQDRISQFPDFCRTLSQVDCRRGEYGYGDALKRLLLDKAEASILDNLHSYWREAFFSNDFLTHDIPHEGAVQFVQHLSHTQIPFVYLTGRPRELMSPGSLQSLLQFGFPASQGILFMKPQPKDIDEEFKSKKIKELKQLKSRTWLIDNEPKILHKIAADHPEVHLIFVDTCHSPNVVAPEGLLTLKDFHF